MMNKALWKDNFRQIKNSLGRFLAVFMIVCLGVSFFVGIKATGPSMQETARQYYTQTNLPDGRLVSSYGLNSNDQEAVSELNYDWLWLKSLLATVTPGDELAHIYPYNGESSTNIFKPVQGKLPQKPNEIALDAKYLEKTDQTNSPSFKIGDTIKLRQAGQASGDQSPKLEVQEFKLVGFVTSSIYFERYQRSGVESTFAIVSDQAISGDLYTEAFYWSNDTRDLKAYSPEYERISQESIQEIEEKLINRPQERLDEVKSDYQVAIKEAEEKIQNGQLELDDGEEKLHQAKLDLNQAKEKIDQAQDQLDQEELELNQAQDLYGANSPDIIYARDQLEKAQEDLSASKKEYQEGLEEFQKQEKDFKQEKEKAQKDIAQAQKDIASHKEEAEKLEEASYQVLGREDFVGYKGVYDNANQLNVISNIFPVLFMLIAILVVSTTITRMVSEERNYMGTMLQMGYGPGSILSKFGLYAGVSSALGAIVGVALGYLVFPPVIIQTYNNLYYLDDLVIVRSWKWELVACLAGFLCAMLPALIKPAQALNTAPANLLRPAPPRSGKKILLERWKSLWSRLSFKTKMTIRNLLRYKGRNFMTLIGVAGCSMLIVTGLGISDTVSGFMDVQFDQIQKYETIVILDQSSDRDEINKVKDQIQNYPSVDKLTGVYGDKLNYQSKSGVQEEINLVVLCDPADQYEELIGLWQRGDEENPIDVSRDGPVVTELFMENEDLDPGEVYTFSDSDHKTCEVPLNLVSENYTDHYLYMTKDQYYDLTGGKVDYNNLYVSFKSDDTSDFNRMLADEEGVIAVVDVESTAQSAKNTMKNLNVITIVLLIAAISLAFVVLYNLTNINIGERIRELSTIKVLGFYDGEVSMYIYREILVLTVLGGGLGLILGKFLTHFIMKTMQMKDLLFYPVVRPWSYVIAFVITILFSMLVMLVMHFKLKKIDMVEALKAVE